MHKCIHTQTYVTNCVRKYIDHFVSWNVKPSEFNMLNIGMPFKMKSNSNFKGMLNKKMWSMKSNVKRRKKSRNKFKIKIKEFLRFNLLI